MSTAAAAAAADDDDDDDTDFSFLRHLARLFWNQTYPRTRVDGSATVLAYSDDDIMWRNYERRSEAIASLRLS